MVADDPVRRHVIASEAKQSILSLRGGMDCFASLAMTEIDMCPHSRSAMRPEFCKKTLPSKSEGAGKTGCAPHPRSRAQNCASNTRTSIQVWRKHTGLPCAMALRLIRFRPGDRLSCHHHQHQLSFPLT